MEGAFAPEASLAALDSPIAGIDAYREGPLGPYLAAQPFYHVSLASTLPADASQRAVLAPWLLQDIGDYRAALQRWFACVEVGGFLVVTVPHAFLHDRSAQLPSLWSPGQKRLYTPASLLAAVEEALAPNTYRVRWLGDQDVGYDYTIDRETPPVGQYEIGLAIERILPPAWTLFSEKPLADPAPGPIFEPERTRVEVSRPSDRIKSILVLKLDHLGDFVMAVPAIQALRSRFPGAHITLVVGSWNEALALDLGIADRVIAFDAFSRNPSEDGVVNMGAKAGEFADLTAGSYDLAIDLRTFGDTRGLLQGVEARYRAGLGNRAIYPFLDIALPIDPDADRLGIAEMGDIEAWQFLTGDLCTRADDHIFCDGEKARSSIDPLVWGPYRQLEPGDYAFRPSIEINFARPGLLGYDIAVNVQPAAAGQLGPAQAEIAFRVEERGMFEFRIWAVGNEPVPDFVFKGGRLFRKGVATTLHQSEYERLLVELVAMRLGQSGSDDAVS